MRKLFIVIACLSLFACSKDINHQETRIIFQPNGGLPVQDMKIDDIDDQIELPLTTKVGHTFLGWYVDDQMTQIFSSDDVLNTTFITLYAKWQVLSFTVRFEDHNGVLLKSETVDYGQAATPPALPSRLGYTFDQWDRDYLEIHNDLVVKPVYTLNIHEIIYVDADETTVIARFTYAYGSVLDHHKHPSDPIKLGYIFAGWPDVEGLMPDQDIVISASYLSVLTLVNMIEVGEKSHVYTMPTGPEDAQTVEVNGGYQLADKQTTYELWYIVRLWAEANGYYFQNLGQAGSEGMIGAPPGDNRFEPVTNVSWYDVAIWLNALSELTGESPVYYDGSEILRNARNRAEHDRGDIRITTSSGYSLPMLYEDEMAARWLNDTSLHPYSIFVGNRYWTKGDHIAGATENWENSDMVSLYAWNGLNTRKTMPVGMLLPNALGFYDTSGNVWEWTNTFDYYINLSAIVPVLRGGPFVDNNYYMKIGVRFHTAYSTADVAIGFRLYKSS